MTGVADMMAAAKARVESVSAADGIGLLGDPDVVIVDVRDADELQENGQIPGAVSVSRGMLEFRIDPASPYHMDVFATAKRYIFTCASGGRAVLAGATAQDLGLERVGYIEGGLKAWTEAGGPVEK